jgi:hypothetical protein
MRVDGGTQICKGSANQRPIVNGNSLVGHAAIYRVIPAEHLTAIKQREPVNLTMRVSADNSPPAIANGLERAIAEKFDGAHLLSPAPRIGGAPVSTITADARYMHPLGAYIKRENISVANWRKTSSYQTSQASSWTASASRSSAAITTASIPNAVGLRIIPPLPSSARIMVRFGLDKFSVSLRGNCAKIQRVDKSTD